MIEDGLKIIRGLRRMVFCKHEPDREKRSFDKENVSVWSEERGKNAIFGQPIPT